MGLESAGWGRGDWDRGSWVREVWVGKIGVKGVGVGVGVLDCDTNPPDPHRFPSGRPLLHFTFFSRQIVLESSRLRIKFV